MSDNATTSGTEWAEDLARALGYQVWDKSSPIRWQEMTLPANPFRIIGRYVYITEWVLDADGDHYPYDPATGPLTRTFKRRLPRAFKRKYLDGRN